MEKSFIDYWLLEDYEELLKYSDFDRIDELNSLELCLLAYSLRNSELEISNTLLECVKMRSQLIKIDLNVKSRLFDTILKMNSME